jgi:3-oxoacyl-[acyl-carrier-protein] synthase II
MISRRTWRWAAFVRSSLSSFAFMLDSESSVVVTGIGLRTSLGVDRETTWSALRFGRTGAAWLSGFDRDGEVAHAGFPLACDPHEVMSEPAVDMCSGLAREALNDSGLPTERDALKRVVEMDRVATLIGLSKGGLRSLARVSDAVDGRTGVVHQQAATGISLQHPASFGDRLGTIWDEYCGPNAGAARVARELGAKGPCLGPIAACATGLVAVLRGVNLIRQGVCDVALCGAADASLEGLVLAAFRKMRAFAVPGKSPARAIRPWDRARSGFLVGEGGAVLVLERAGHARARGAVPYAEIAGGALGSDAFHITDLNSDPTDLADLIGRALAASSIVAADIDYVNVHGTATRVNDPLECRAIRRAFRGHADSLCCSANKAQIGHTLGAAGAVELAITCLAMRDGFAPPTVNLDDPDPACDLDGTPRVGRERRIAAALKLSIGFGGHLAAAVLTRTGRMRIPCTRVGPSEDSETRGV